MQPDPRDPLCCKVPKCIQTGQTTPQYNVIPPRQVTGGVKPDSLNLIPQPLTTPSYISPSAHTTIYPYPTMKQPEPSYTPMIQTTQIPVYKSKSIFRLFCSFSIPLLSIHYNSMVNYLNNNKYLIDQILNLIDIDVLVVFFSYRKAVLSFCYMKVIKKINVMYVSYNMHRRRNLLSDALK